MSANVANEMMGWQRNNRLLSHNFSHQNFIILSGAKSHTISPTVVLGQYLTRQLLSSFLNLFIAMATQHITNLSALKSSETVSGKLPYSRMA